jgi:hypothetical protein
MPEKQIDAGTRHYNHCMPLVLLFRRCNPLANLHIRRLNSAQMEICPSTIAAPVHTRRDTSIGQASSAGSLPDLGLILCLLSKPWNPYLLHDIPAASILVRI